MVGQALSTLESMKLPMTSAAGEFKTVSCAAVLGASIPVFCRSDDRSSSSPGHAINGVGFRSVLSLESSFPEFMTASQPESSCEEALHHAPMHVRQAELAALVAVG